MKIKFYLKIFLFLLGALSSYSFASQSIKVGISIGPSMKIMNVAKKIAKEKYDLTLEIIPFADYQIPNEALNSGDIDANIFQTNSFLQQTVNKRGYKLTVVGNTFIYPMGIYSRKIKNVANIIQGASIAIPNDPSNQARALFLLEHAGLIKLKESFQSGYTPTPRDIISNPKELKIQSIDAAQIARAVQDVTAAVINNDFVENAGFKSADALFKEEPKSAQPYINVIVVKEENKNKKVFQELKNVMNSQEILNETTKLFPGAVPAW